MHSPSCLWLLASLLQGALPTQNEGPALEAGSGRTLRLEDGASALVSLTPGEAGWLHLWAESADLDPRLRVRAPGGKVLAEDDDAGGGTTAFLALRVEAGAVLSIEVASGAADAMGVVRLESRSLTAADADDVLDLAEMAGMLEFAEGERGRAVVGEALELALSVVRTDPIRAGEAGGFPVGPVELMPLLVRAGDVAETLQDLKRARVAREIAWRFREHALPPDHPELQVVRQDLADNRSMLGDVAGADELYVTLLRARERTLPEDDAGLQESRRGLAIARVQRGDLEGARELFEQVFEVLRRTRGEDDLATLRAEGNLGSVLYDLGRLHESRLHRERVLEGFTGRLDETDAYLLTARENLAATMADLGDLEGARRLMEEVLAVRERTLPAGHPLLDRTRSNLAAVHGLAGDMEGARELYEVVLASRIARLGPDHLQVLFTLRNLALTLDSLERARSIQEDVLARYLEQLPAYHPDLRAARRNLARTLAELGELERADALLDEALATMRLALSADNPDLLLALGDSAQVALARDDRERAHALVAEMAAGIRTGVAVGLPSYGPREVEEWAANVSDRASLVLSLSHGETDLEREGFVVVESLRSLALASAELLRAGASAPDLQRLRADVRHATGELVSAARAGAEPSEISAIRLRLDAARTALVRSIAGRQGTGFVEPTIERLARELAADEVLVAFWRYRDPEPIAGGSERQDRLLAHVLKSDGTLARVELGPLRAVEQSVAGWRAALGVVADPRGDRGGDQRGEPLERSPSPDERGAAAALAALVLAPLGPAVADARRWVVLPDDVLHLVPFAALPGADGDPLGARVRITYRTSAQDLLRAGAAEPDGEVLLLAFGGVDYGVPGESGARSFSPLPETAAEVDEIALLFERHAGPGARALVLKGDAATRAALERQGPGARVLHLATHGWFGPAGSATGEESASSDAVRGLSPLSLCGLALAGANEAPDANGRLAAQQLAALDLSRCELAVLSACDTSIGLRRAGQGVASLQKALAMAGARSVVTSLWAVPDRATRELMTNFYRGLLTEGLTKDEALWRAKSALRATGAPVRDWAGWVLTGVPRPLGE